MGETFDLSSAMAYNILLFKLLGYWKWNDKGKVFKNIYLLYRYFCISCNLTFLVSQATYIFVHRKNVQAITATMFMFLTFTMSLIKMTPIYLKMDFLIETFRALKENHYYQAKHEDHFKVARANRTHSFKMMYICIILSICTDSFLCGYNLFSPERNVSTLALRGWFPYDITNSANYFATVIYTDFILVYNTMMCLLLDTLAANLLIELGNQCDFLSFTLKNLNYFQVIEGVLVKYEHDKANLQDNFSERMIKNLIVCVKHHQRIKKLAAEIESMYSTSILIFFVVGCLIICTSLYQLTVSKFGTLNFTIQLFCFLCFLTDQFLYCWYGNELTSNNLSISMYETRWLNCNTEFKKMQMIFMSSVQRPIVIYVGNLFPMSLAVLVNILRTSYSYFTLLKQL